MICDPIQRRKGYLHKQSGGRGSSTTVKVRGGSTTRICIDLHSRVYTFEMLTPLQLSVANCFWWCIVANCFKVNTTIIH